MKPRFVDTNVFLELLVRQGSKNLRCKRLFEKNIRFWTTILVIAEVEWVLRSSYEAPKKRIVDGLRKLLGLRFLEIENRDLLIEALQFYENKNVDFTDCLNALMANKDDIDQVYSYDRDFDKFDFLTRREP